MRTGFVSFDRMAYEESIAKAAEFGFDFLELMMDGDAHREALASESAAIVDRLEARQLDLLVHCPYPLVIGSPHEHQRRGAVEELQRCIEVAVELGAEKGVVHPDTHGWDRVWDESTLADFVAESVRELDAFADDRGFEICVENHFYRGALDFDQFDRLLQATDASLTFDTGHAALAGLDEAAMADFLNEHRERVSHLHLNDNRHADAGYRGRDEHLPLGYGSLDFETILEPLVAGTWDGTVSIELDTDDFGYLRDSQERLERLLA